MKLQDFPPHILDTLPPMFEDEIQNRFDDTKTNTYTRVIPQFYITYYDGPLKGIIMCQNQYFYAATIHIYNREWWAVWEISDDEKEVLLKNNEDYTKNVSNGSNYIMSQNGEKFVRDTTASKTATEESIKDYYKRNPTKDARNMVSTIEQREIFGIVENPF